MLISVCFIGAQQGHCQEAIAPGEPNVQLGTHQFGTLQGNKQVLLPETLTAPSLETTAGTIDAADPSTFSESRTTPELDDITGSDAALGDADKPAATVKPHVEQELIIEGLVSYGNYTLWASGWDQHLYTAGIEYDRHSWGHFLRARMDYVAEFLPLVLLRKPVMVDIYGNPEPYKTHNRPMEIVPGMDISPIGFRWQWLSNRAIKPYLELKGGMIGFTQKVPNRESTYENFSLQSCMGVQVRMNERWGLRLGLFSDFHFSNAYVVPIDPGLDVMSASLGFSYHF